MLGKKRFLLGSIKVGDRLLYPIVSLKVLTYDNLFLSVDYDVLAFKIVEKDKTYYKNVKKKKKEFEKIKEI